MTEQEAETCQQWRGMDGVTAFHLIERHADDWEDIAMMMGAWRRANEAQDVVGEREACAKMLELPDSELLPITGEMTAQELRAVKAVLAQRAAAIRMRANGKHNLPTVPISPRIGIAGPDGPVAEGR